MVNCPCKSRRCSCTLTGDVGIVVSGNGSGRQPYIPKWALFNLTGLDTSQADVTITGTGAIGDPWVIKIDTLGGSVVQTIYLNDDTWDKGGGNIAHVVAIGGGGGGGTASSVGRAAGGSGGSGGAMSVGWFLTADLPASVPIKVGQAGAGGRPVDGLTTGGDGGDSWFGEFLYAGGGKGGKSQVASAQTQYTTLGGTPPEGGAGGAGAVRNGAGVSGAPDHRIYLSPTGGGNGEGSTVPASGAGWLPMQSWGGEGGDGGDLSIIGGTHPNGQPGNLYGGGGGGGGSATSGTKVYSGGDGAPGIVVVTVW